ncbi:MAG: hypothetical protein IIC67_06290 [Thaumarchaeota archaeon]|nr:hypothetical protein [Nitrososphaerota archaeon]
MSDDIVDHNLIFNFIDDQKSVFVKEQNSIDKMMSTLVDEFRTSTIQTASITAFIVTLLFSIVSLSWVSPEIGQFFIVLSVLISSILIVSTEYFRHRLLLSKLQISNAYDDRLWTLSEIKRNITTQIVTNEILDYRIFYFFIFRVICSERIIIQSTWKVLLEIKIFKTKKDDFKQFYTSSEDIIKRGMETLDIFADKFNESEFLEKLLHLIEPLKNYKIQS